jgi:hypothetical protein
VLGDDAPRVDVGVPVKVVRLAREDEADRNPSYHF